MPTPAPEIAGLFVEYTAPIVRELAADEDIVIAVADPESNESHTEENTALSEIVTVEKYSFVNESRLAVVIRLTGQPIPDP